MSVDSFLTFIHILSAALIIGGETFLHFLIYPLLLDNDKEITKDSLIVKVLDRTLPVTFGLSLLIIVTGVIHLFKLYSYFQNVDSTVLITLGVKIFSILLILALSAYQTFNLRSKITSLHPFHNDSSEIPALVRKSHVFSLLIILAVAIALFLGLSFR